MGNCASSSNPFETEEDRVKNRMAEKELRETKSKIANQTKVLLLGPGDSGKSTILKQMRLLHSQPFTAQEVEQFRQLVFNNLTYGLKCVLDAMADLELKVESANAEYVDLIEDAQDIKDGEVYPRRYFEPLRALWADPSVRATIERGNEFALPENLSYFFNDLERLFAPTYVPAEVDIVHTRARTTGILETQFDIKGRELLMVDVGGQKSERRKWIHCFQDVTTILFIISLSGYDQCLVEDKDANQMQDAMTIWDSISNSQWFKKTNFILFLNKNDLFEQKIKHSSISASFPDYTGQPGDAAAGRQYFKTRFIRLANKPGSTREREIYTHTTTATDGRQLKAVMLAVTDMVLRGNLERAAII